MLDGFNFNLENNDEIIQKTFFYTNLEEGWVIDPSTFNCKYSRTSHSTDGGYSKNQCISKTVLLGVTLDKKLCICEFMHTLCNQDNL